LPISDPADDAIHEIVGSPAVTVATAVAATAEDAEITRELVSVPFVGQVMNVEVSCGAAVHAASAGAGERIPAACLPLWAT
jgi:hypothetical protein